MSLVRSRPSLLESARRSLRLAPIGTALIAHPGSELYGSDRVMLETVAALVERGWSVTVTTPEDGPLLAEVRRRGAETLVLPVPVLRKSLLRPAGLARLAFSSLTALAQSARLLHVVRPDLVYVSTVTVPTWLVAARLAGIPAIAHVHEAERKAPRPLRAALALPLVLASRVIVNSAFSRDTLGADLPVLARRAEVVYNGVAGPDREQAARPALEGTLRVGYVGRLSPRKGVHVAIDAVAQLRSEGTDATLDVIGAVFPGYEWYADQLGAQVTSLGLDDHVRFRGFQPSVWDALAAVDVVVVPSVVDEPFGNTAVEAVLACRPVVVSRSGGLPEAVAHFASARVVPPEDPPALAEALRTIAETWPDARDQALEDSSRAADRFSPEIYRESVAGHLQELTVAGRRGVRLEL